MAGCIFCRVISGELPGRFVYRDNHVVAFKDIVPKAPVHVLVVPVKHIAGISDANENDQELLGKLLLAVKKVAKDLKIEQSGYKIVVNNGEGAGQVVFHLHLHVIGGWKEKQQW